MHSRGYVYLKTPGHPRAGKSGYVKRATLVLENKIGRMLRPGELAHHINENKADDAPANLEVMTRSEHQKHHTTGKKRPR